MRIVSVKFRCSADIGDKIFPYGTLSIDKVMKKADRDLLIFRNCYKIGFLRWLEMSEKLDKRCKRWWPESLKRRILSFFRKCRKGIYHAAQKRKVSKNYLSEYQG